MANKNFKARIGIEAPLIAADDGTTAITLSGANVTVVGDLTVSGTTTTIDTQNLLVEDKNVVIGNVASPTDVTADGGGITLKGTTDKTITWVDSTDSWTFNQNIATTGTLDVQGGTITESTGALTISTGASNGNITLDPNGTGNVALTLADGGNLTNSRNYVFGAIRNSTTAAAGDIWALNVSASSTPTRGISIDNSADTAKTASYVTRTYGSTAGNRSRLVFERARGTAASPTAVQAGDFLGEIDATGCNGTGTWVNDTLSTVPGFFGFNATENWASNTNLGTSLSVALAPTATTITTGTNLIQVLNVNPQGTAVRSDIFGIGRGKTSAFVATGCSTSGTTLTIGTLTSGSIAVGQCLNYATTPALNGMYIVANISGSGSGSTWTLSGSPGTLSGMAILGNTGYIGGTGGTTVDALSDLRLLKNAIKGSGGTTQIVTSSAGATLELRGDEIQLEDAAGTAIKGGLINYRRTHGCFHKIANVTAAAADTVYEFDWYTDTTAHVGNQGVTVTSGNPTRVNIDTAGRYTAFMEMQVKNTLAAPRTAWIWLAKNGTDIAETRIKADIKQGGTNDAYQLISKLWLLDNIAANDYIEVRFAVDDVTGISLEYEAAQTTPFVMPAQPSATLTIVPVGA